LANIRTAVRARQAGDRFRGTLASQSLFNAVDGMSHGLPHTNEAAKAARANGEAMQHRFGIPSLFLTVTFDNENS
jgi:hypothetical protein